MTFLTVKEVESKIGESIKTLRLQKNITREFLCEKADISMNALRHLESGQGISLKTLIKILLVLGKQDWILALAPEISINPLKLTRKGTRQRASRVKKVEKSDLKHKEKLLIGKYGITLEQYVGMFNFQEGLCGNPGCKTPLNLKSSKTHVDHNHVTGKVRSLLCFSCNTSLGFLKEDKNKISGLIDYVTKHNG